MSVEKEDIEIIEEEDEKEKSRTATFPNKLYSYMSEKDGNFVFSPLSVHIVLSMILQGAENLTKQALEDALDSEMCSVDDNKNILQSIKSNSRADIKVKSKVYALTRVPNKIQVYKKFKSVLAKYFYSKFDVLSLNKVDCAQNTVNSWVKKKTSGSVKNFIEKLDTRPGLLLVNVIYFKSEWKNKFEPCGETPFYYDNKETSDINVEMMEAIGRYKYTRDEKLKIEVIEIPYKHKKYQMVILLPYERDGLHELEQQLQTYDTESLLVKLAIDEFYIKLYLPKFKMTETTNLKLPLSHMGLSDIFDEKAADFSKMIKLNPYENVHVREILQKCILEVSEEGTNVAAAPVVDMGAEKCLVRTPPVDYTVTVNHPAIFMLTARYKKRTVIVFYGRLDKPNY